MATHSSILTWRIPWTEKPGRLQPMGLQKVGVTEWLNNTEHVFRESFPSPDREHSNCPRYEGGDGIWGGGLRKAISEVRQEGCRGVNQTSLRSQGRPRQDSSCQDEEIRESTESPGTAGVWDPQEWPDQRSTLWPHYDSLEVKSPESVSRSGADQVSIFWSSHCSSVEKTGWNRTASFPPILPFSTSQNIQPLGSKSV